MASDNETVADIVREMVEFGNHCAAFGGAYSPERWNNLCKRLIAAHNREVEKLNKRLEHVVNDINRICGLCESSKKILELRKCLREAEDALDKIYKCIDNRYGVDASMLAKNIIADAIAAIRWKEEQ